jgi:hypothetical protein
MDLLECASVTLIMDSANLGRQEPLQCAAWSLGSRWGWHMLSYPTPREPALEPRVYDWTLLYALKRVSLNCAKHDFMSTTADPSQQTVQATTATNLTILQTIAIRST